MRHDHIVVTLDPESKARIEADLDAGESVEAWVADAVERKLDGGGDETGCENERDGYEFVDDCAI